jgi:hypothetical protein
MAPVATPLRPFARARVWPSTSAPHHARRGRQGRQELACHLPLWTRRRLGGHRRPMYGHVYINHSRDANCETSEEITYDYCLYDSGPEDREVLCSCGSATCRGTMYSKEEIRRRNAAASRPTRNCRRTLANRRILGILLSDRSRFHTKCHLISQRVIFRFFTFSVKMSTSIHGAA